MRQPDEMSHATALPGLEIRAPRRGVLVLGGKALEVAIRAGHRREFIERVFSMPKLSALKLGVGEARLRFEAGAGTTR
jgi:hypothetical protein